MDECVSPCRMETVHVPCSPVWSPHALSGTTVMVGVFALLPLSDVATSMNGRSLRLCHANRITLL